MPYGVAVGALAIIFILIMLILIAQRRLLPGVMMLFSFILLVLFVTGIIGTAMQLFGGPNINNQCNTYVFSNRQTGAGQNSLNTLAWLQQQNICEFESGETYTERVCVLEGVGANEILQVNAGRLNLRFGSSGPCFWFG